VPQLSIRNSPTNSENFLAAASLSREVYPSSSELDAHVLQCTAAQALRVFLLSTAAAPLSLLASSLVQDPSDR